MHPVAYIDLVSVFACLAALVFLVRGRKRPGFSRAIPLLLLVLLVLMTCYRIALFLEWSGIAADLDWVEDFGGVFIPFTWAFIFYAFVKNAVEDDLRASLSERIRAEKDLVANQQRLRSLASELSLAEERERRRIATGLHDHACQNLVFSKMKLQGLCEPLPPADADEIAGVCHALDRTIENVRDLIFDLSTPTLYKFGLEAALKELLEEKLDAQHGIDCTFHDDGAPKPLAEDVRVLLFQSVRELLINIVKHAQARAVTVDVVRLADSVKITVADDGIGFDVAEILTNPTRRRGFGLFNIRERLDFIGGSLEIDSQRGHGSRFTLLAHLEPQAGAMA
jgi:signal transduction histidine kinase